MAGELLRARTGSGLLIVTERSVTLERPALGTLTGHADQTIWRSAITSVDHRITLFGAARVVIHGQGEDRMEIRGMRASVARTLLALLR